MVQRRRTAEDEINMRTIFKEGDLISVSFWTKPLVPEVTHACGKKVCSWSPQCSTGLFAGRLRSESLQAEVQSLHADGSIALHTRSAKYGKVSV